MCHAVKKQLTVNNTHNKNNKHTEKAASGKYDKKATACTQVP